MLYTLIVLLASFITVAAPFEKWKCSAEISKIAHEWKSSPEWSRQQMNGLESEFYASPAQDVGTWILAMKTSKGVAVAKANQEGRLEAVFVGKDCRPVLRPYTNQKVSPHYFSDQNLKDHVLKNRNGIVYVWSPRMHLSEAGISEIKKAALKAKLPLLVLLSKDIPEKEYLQLRSKLGSEVTKQVDSFELKMRNVDLHFPALLVFKNKKFKPGIKYGFEKVDGYVGDINELMAR